MEEADGQPWFHDIKQYIKFREYPTGASEANKKTIRRLSMAFFLSGEILYKRNYDGALLRCVDAEEAQAIIIEVHKRFMGHMLMVSQWLAKL